MAQQITRFDSSNLDEVRDQINNTLAAVLKQYGLTAKIGNIRYSSNDFRTTLTVSTGSNADAAQREFERHAYKFGLAVDLFGKSFMHHGEKFTITGIKPKSRKYPVLAKNAKGTTYKFTAMTAQGAK